MATIETTIKETPDDLMTFKEICSKYGYNYGFLYKWSVIMGAITLYFRGTWKLSVQEVLNFSEKLAKEKLTKIKTRKAGV